MSQGLKLIRQGKADKVFLRWVSCCAAQAVPTFASLLSCPPQLGLQVWAWLRKKLIKHMKANAWSN